jgi:hypothetical protein
MALHTPVQQIGTSHHLYRNALLAVGVAIVAVVLVAAALLIKPASTPTATTTDRLMTPQMIEFRAGERALQPVAISIPGLLP